MRAWFAAIAGDNRFMNERHMPTAVFVHGAGGGGWEWIVWRRVFEARGAGVLAPDLLPVADGLAATRLHDYVRQVVDWCGIAAPAPLLFGASLGGLIALVAAGQAAPAAIVLVNPLPPAGIEPRPAAREYRDIVAWGRERSLPGTRRAMADADAAAQLFAFRRWRDESGVALRDACSGIAVDALPCPLLVLAGGHDEDVPAASSRALAARFGGDFRELRRAGHLGPLLGRDAAAAAEAAWEWCVESTRPA